MANRTEVFLHRWLPIAAAAAAAVFVVILVVVKPLISAQERQEIEASRAEALAALAARGPATSPTVLPALVVADARSVLDRAAQAATSLDGDPRVVEAVAQIVAENDTIQRLWVVNDRGMIVYFGRERPRQLAVEKLAPEEVHRLLAGLPQGLLTPEQRLAILIHAAVQMEHPEPSPGRYLPPRSDLHSEVRRLPGGWVAVAAAAPQEPPYPVNGSVPSTRTALLRELGERTILLCFLVYWLSLPIWVTLDALRRHERAPVWGIFTLIGNIIGLIVYLLARREV